MAEIKPYFPFGVQITEKIRRCYTDKGSISEKKVRKKG